MGSVIRTCSQVARMHGLEYVQVHAARSAPHAWRLDDGAGQLAGKYPVDPGPGHLHLPSRSRKRMTVMTWYISTDQVAVLRVTTTRA